MAEYEPLGQWPDDWDRQPPASPPPPPPRRRAPVVVAVVAVVALVAAFVVVFAARDGGDETAEVPDITSSVPPEDAAPPLGEGNADAGAPATAQEVEAAVAELSRFVEGARQLAFLRPVNVRLLDDDAFGQRLAEDLAEDRADFESDERVLRALRLIDDDVDLFAAYSQFLTGAVLGFYDPESEELVVRGAQLSPYVRSTLVHELTHALDDQHFELDRDELEDSDDEREYAYSALYEGNAVRVADDWLATRTEEEREQAQLEERAFVGDVDITRIPEFIVSINAFPYLFGEELVGLLESEGGERRINDAFTAPPETTEQVIDPQAYLRGEEPVRVSPPAADGDVIDQGAIGQWVLYLLLQAELDQQQALAASVGWGGDWYVAWDDADRTCVRAGFAMDSSSELDELGNALRDWAEEHGDASVDNDDDGRVTFTACG